MCFAEHKLLTLTFIIHSIYEKITIVKSKRSSVYKNVLACSCARSYKLLAARRYVVARLAPLRLGLIYPLQWTTLTYMVKIFEIFINGVPKPKGSWIPRQRKDGSMFLIPDCSKMREWENMIIKRSKALIDTVCNGKSAYRVDMYFLMPRPNNHFTSNNPLRPLKASAPEYHTKKPDLDKLVRCVHDALCKAELYKDDCQVVAGEVFKTYATEEGPGVIIKAYRIC